MSQRASQVRDAARGTPLATGAAREVRDMCMALVQRSWWFGVGVVVALAVALGSARTRAHADAPPRDPAVPLLAHVEIADVTGTQRAATDHAVFVSPSGEPGELRVDVPGQLSTSIKLRYVGRGASTPGAAGVIDYEVMRSAPDKSSLHARGEIAAPAPGTRVLIARLPRGSGSVEIALTFSR
jgi:hypothetical protein